MWDLGFCLLLFNYAGLFSFKNYQLMHVTDSLFRLSGRAVAKPIGVNLAVPNPVGAVS